MSMKSTPYTSSADRRPLLTRAPRRLFAFGCSFTSYHWPCWPEIVAHDLGIPFHNYGRAGAGNQYIFSMMMLADSHHGFCEDDLIMITWTNFCREDRYVNGEWVCPGNIFTQSYYDQDYVMRYADPYGYMLRDMAAIKATFYFLSSRGCQFHQMKMLDFTMADQWELDKKASERYLSAMSAYGKYLSMIRPSYYEVLWNNDLESKIAADERAIGPGFFDVHPTTSEHLCYLSRVFDHEFNPSTLAAVDASTKNTLDTLRRENVSKKDRKSLLDYRTIDLAGSELARGLRQPIIQP